jgi:hypothetical protein
MRRLLFVPLLTLAGVGALALPAHAKGPVESASGQVVITGPGLKAPIELDGTVSGFAEPGDGFMPLAAESQGEFTDFLFGSGMLTGSGMAEGPLEGWYVLRPDDLRAIGPAYQVRLNLAGEGWRESLTRQLYPFAPERPLVFTPAESVTIAARVRMQQLRGLWWSAPPTLLGILRSHGLPLAPPPVPRPAPVAAPALPGRAQGWVVLWTGLAFLGLLLAGALVGRRRIRVA